MAEGQECGPGEGSFGTRTDWLCREAEPSSSARRCPPRHPAPMRSAADRTGCQQGTGPETAPTGLRLHREQGIYASVFSTTQWRKANIYFKAGVKGHLSPYVWNHLLYSRLQHIRILPINTYWGLRIPGLGLGLIQLDSLPTSVSAVWVAFGKLPNGSCLIC